jgi:hypothetical protein
MDRAIASSSWRPDVQSYASFFAARAGVYSSSVTCLPQKTRSPGLGTSIGADCAHPV